MGNNNTDKLKAAGAEADSGTSSGSGEGVVQPCPSSMAYIEIALVDKEGKPIKDGRYMLVTPDGKQRQGKTDAKGIARIEGIQEGICKVSFPCLAARTIKRVKG
jgi:hypothetical protein